MTTHPLPRSRRAALLVGALAFGLLATGCGGSDGDDATTTTAAPADGSSAAPGATGTGTATATDEGSDLPDGVDYEAPDPGTGDSDPPATGPGSCTVSGEVTGAIEASWTDEPGGTVSTENAGLGAPPAFYQFAQDGISVSLYAAGETGSQAPNVIVAGDPGSFTPAVGVTMDPSTVAPDGSGADIDVDLQDIDSTEAHITATFTCE